VEYPDLFTTRIDRAFVDAAPRIVQHDGADWWVVEGDLQVPALNPSRAGDRFDEREVRRSRTSFERDIRLGGLDPDEWVKDNETDGVWGGVLFPSMSLVFYGIEDSALLTAVCRVYTDWACEFAAAHPDRLRAVAMINLDDVDAAVAELQRARDRGAAGCLIPVAMPTGRTYDSPVYEPFWAAAADLVMPVNLHVATNRGRGRWRSERLSQSFANPDFHVRVALGDLIMSGVFVRHPQLRVGSIEHEAGWAAFWLQQMDHAVRHRIDLAAGVVDEPGVHRLHPEQLAVCRARRVEVVLRHRHVDHVAAFHLRHQAPLVVESVGTSKPYSSAVLVQVIRTRSASGTPAKRSARISRDRGKVDSPCG
jgi:hypothetical protein